MAPVEPVNKASTQPKNQGGGDGASSPAKEVKDNVAATADHAGSVSTSVSSAVDPAPHYLMSAACGGGGLYAYNNLRNPRAAAIAGGFALLYFTAGRLLQTGNSRAGYDLGTATSVALLATTAKPALSMGDPYSVAMASLAGISSVTNTLKSYQDRTGKPHENVNRSHA